jgi:hypothetical protein
MRLSIATSPLLLLLSACSSSALGTSPLDAGGDATGATDAAGDALGPPDGAGDVVIRPDGGVCRTDPPTYHRPSAAACPSHSPDAGFDSGLVDCPPNDACLVDSDCADAGVCECNTPHCVEPFGVSGNVCLPSNCHVDSDCACGFCAGEQSCGGIDAYYCTTPLDECATDADCRQDGSYASCRWKTDHWGCVPAMGCPG